MAVDLVHAVDYIHTAIDFVHAVDLVEDHLDYIQMASSVDLVHADHIHYVDLDNADHIHHHVDLEDANYNVDYLQMAVHLVHMVQVDDIQMAVDLVEDHLVHYCGLKP